MLNRPRLLSLVSRPTVNVRPLVSERACSLRLESQLGRGGQYAAPGLRPQLARVVHHLETVPRETPARFAT